MRILSIIIFLLSLPLGLYAQLAKEAYIGSWKSNRELTIKTLQFKREIKPELRQRFDDLFGKMIVTYTGKEVIAYTPATEKSAEWRFTSEYTVVMASDTKLVFRGQNPQTKAIENTTITFEGPDRYWTSLDVSGVLEGREYFDRIKTNEPNKALVPTVMSVTPAADAPVAPATTAAHL
jgi:hypothetical protein